jgi:uncharacterized damage-inducible protein DinB
MSRFQSVICLASALFAGPALSQQPTGFLGEYLDEWDGASMQILQLAEAVPAEKYSWRPAPGVRSVSEVYMHIAGANFLLLDIAGVKAPDDLYGAMPAGGKRSEALVKKNAELEKSITDKQKVMALLKRSFAAVNDNFSKTTEAQMNQPVDFFGSKLTVRAMYLRILVHNNEHKGQSVAYARMNGIVPPWSR